MHNIKIGDRLEIRIKREGEVPKIYVSQIVDITTDNAVTIYTPTSYGKEVVLQKSMPCTLLIFQEDGMLNISAVVMGTFSKDSHSLTKVMFTSKPEKMQRREFFRFDCTLPIRFSLIHASAAGPAVEPNEGSQPKLFEGIIKDIGGGGLRFVTNSEMDNGDNVKCLLLLERDYIVVIGKILQKHSFPKSPYKFQYRVIFIGILPEEKDKIVQYVFNQQRKFLLRQRRGLTAEDPQ
ncbi:MAG: PilZ domain-containing protein [Defluviitaleaceae bacterium]|nr:PilZ domain-containing protein [Defluviitaleaceae bacterium]